MLNQSSNLKLDHDWIANHIPHQGKMCLLKSVKSWDQDKITCIADSHRVLDNPLRAHDKLGIACGIEYAAQAMAVHGSLLAPVNSAKPKVGYLVSVRGVTMSVTRLDDIEEDLVINAVCMMASESNMLYQFTLSANDKILLEGRATVVLDADSLLIKPGN
ncbi:MAG: 3-hydroxylacyl-ACP dehydratase [Pseudomonadota bacterium]